MKFDGLVFDYRPAFSCIIENVDFDNFDIADYPSWQIKKDHRDQPYQYLVITQKFGDIEYIADLRPRYMYSDVEQQSTVNLKKMLNDGLALNIKTFTFRLAYSYSYCVDIRTDYHKKVNDTMIHIIPGDRNPDVSLFIEGEVDSDGPVCAEICWRELEVMQEYVNAFVIILKAGYWLPGMRSKIHIGDVNAMVKLAIV